MDSNEVEIKGHLSFCLHWPGLAKPARIYWGMNSTRPLNVCCGINMWAEDPFRPLMRWGLHELFVQCLLQMIRGSGEFGGQVNTMCFSNRSNHRSCPRLATVVMLVVHVSYLPLLHPGALCSLGKCFQPRSRVSMATLTTPWLWRTTGVPQNAPNIHRSAVAVPDHDPDPLFLLRLILIASDHCRPGTPTKSTVSTQSFCAFIAAFQEITGVWFASLCCKVEPRVIFALWNLLIFSHSNKTTRVPNGVRLCYNRLLVLIVFRRKVLLRYVLALLSTGGLWFWSSEQ